MIPQPTQAGPSKRVKTSVDRGLHEQLKRLLARRFLGGSLTMQVIDVMDEALREWLKAQPEERSEDAKD